MEIQKKCPNCGALIPSLSLKCIECGYVFSKESESSEIAREAIERLQGMLKDMDQSNAQISKKNLAKAKATIITTFVVPNTKEAMINFLILAYSNIESSSESQDMAITMAWEARAISTYNLLKLQQDSDPQIEAVLKKYSILEDKKKLAKIDGRAKRKTRMLAGLLAVLILFSIPFILSLANDPILVAIEEGRYDEAIDRINNDGKLKRSVEFYIDKLAASPLMEYTFQRDYDSITGIVTLTTYYTNATDIHKWYTKDPRNIYEEVITTYTDDNTDDHVIDTLNLGEKLWSISGSPELGNYLYGCRFDDSRIQFDSKGRCKQITCTDPWWGYTKIYYKYNEDDIVIQQDIIKENESIRITSEVEKSGNSYTFMDYKSTNGGEPELASMRVFNDKDIIEQVEYFSILGSTYTIGRTSWVETDRLKVTREERIPIDELMQFNLSAELKPLRVILRDRKSGKGVSLNYYNLTDMEQKE